MPKAWWRHASYDTCSWKTNKMIKKEVCIQFRFRPKWTIICAVDKQKCLALEIMAQRLLLQSNSKFSLIRIYHACITTACSILYGNIFTAGSYREHCFFKQQQSLTVEKKGIYQNEIYQTWICLCAAQQWQRQQQQVRLSAHLNANAMLLFKQMWYLISRLGECISGLSNEISDSIPREWSHLTAHSTAGG